MSGPAPGINAAAGAIPCWTEKLDELLEPPLPGSEQLRLQHTRAIETSGVFWAEWAFLQQSGMLAIGQLPSCASACTPTVLAARANIRIRVVGHLIMNEYHYSEPPTSASSNALNLSNNLTIAIGDTELSLLPLFDLG